MTTQLNYYAYVSRAKVAQLHDQITEYAVKQRSVRRGTQGNMQAGAGASGLFGFLKGDIKIAASGDSFLEESGAESYIHKLNRVLDHIEKHEKVQDLRRLCVEAANVPLDAFCYRYSGRFFVLGHLRRRYRGIDINRGALERAGDDILISKSNLLEPARKENELAEVGPNNSALVSDICILNSQAGEYTISLACSLKYFANMGWSYDATENECDVHPHSGNYHFFEAEGNDQWFDTLLFVNGLKDKNIMGTPLFMLHSRNLELAI